MKRKIAHKAFIFVFCLVLSFNGLGVITQAKEIQITNNNQVSLIAETTITLFADDIRTIYRTTADGKLQKRRWNYTRGCWVDPYWITISL